MSSFNSSDNLQEIYGNIDIYLFDQLLKGTYKGCVRVLDAGCGSGRNIQFFLKQGLEVFGVDQDPQAIAALQQLYSGSEQDFQANHFVVAEVEELPFDDNSFDLVISSAVLHFAKNLEHFEQMLSSMWRVLKKDGYFFCRLASDIGIESSLHFVGNGRYILPDGSERFLVNQEMLLRLTRKLGGTLHEPIKTTIVQNMRSMTTWCLRK
ncbi:class I SAM-dependent methyltransferase [Pedobacter miscanthi]|uniref:Class I SAM-dependent methyltransferase n=1 Tax=Pedobacter miscanthi TaxID=2259170 RepID=A0A366LE62_9SPHI|nr:class I SAM-dependent methyltransferase [Pedobacter miscanthi]RBQ11789.1 class I SAM-dependent methyltransferase [Pedobacter miscanthi]